MVNNDAFFKGKVKIISDGTAWGTKVLDSSGNLIGAITKLEMTVKEGEPLVMVKLELIPGKIEINNATAESRSEISGKFVRPKRKITVKK
jgi:hypothetical protein